LESIKRLLEQADRACAAGEMERAEQLFSEAQQAAGADERLVARELTRAGMSGR